jgi:chaperonin GroEL (HSP60 family)
VSINRLLLYPKNGGLQLFPNLFAETRDCFGMGEQSCYEMVCLEPVKVKRSVIRSPYEVSSIMLRIDELLISNDIAKFHKK